MLEFARTRLGDIDCGNKREDDIRRKSVLDLRFHTQGICCIDQNASVLGGNDRFDDASQVIDVRQSLDA